MSKRRRSLVRLTVRLTVKYQDVDSSQRKKGFIATLTCLKSNTRKFEWIVSFILVVIKYAHPPPRVGIFFISRYVECEYRLIIRRGRDSDHGRSETRRIVIIN